MTYLIKPLNEGQELNYIETFKGSLDGAKKRALQIANGLKPILKDGIIGCSICDNLDEDVGWFDSQGTWNDA